MLSRTNSASSIHQILFRLKSETFFQVTSKYYSKSTTLKLDRVRCIEILELADKFDPYTANLAVELANWLNAKLSFTMIKNVIDKSLQANFNEITMEEDEVNEVHSRRKKIAKIQEDLFSLPIELGFDFLTLEDRNDIQKWLSHSSADVFLISGLLKDVQFGWRASLLSYLDKSSMVPIAIVPEGEISLNFHTLIVPYHLDLLTDEKLILLKWFVEQMGLLVEFVHITNDEEAKEDFELTDKSEKAMQHIEEYFNYNLVKFYFPRNNNFIAGLNHFLKHKNNYIIAFIDEFGKNAYLGKGISKEQIQLKKSMTMLF